jgi:hypothetical protein
MIIIMFRSMEKFNSKKIDFRLIKSKRMITTRISYGYKFLYL